MRYFWHFISAVAVLGTILILFFVFSLRWADNIAYTDEQITAPSVTIADPSLGPSDAAVTIVNFGDYQCEDCARMEGVLGQLMEDFPNDVRLVWKDMPNTSAHLEALDAALAARCGGEQGKFWEFHSLLFANQRAISDELYVTIAQELELRERAFISCMEDQDPGPLVQRTYEEGLALNISATPTLFINGERYTGAIDLPSLKAVVRAYVK